MASRMLRALADGIQVCVTVTLSDGLVLARSAFHHSMNYRSVVVFGTASAVEPISFSNLKFFIPSAIRLCRSLRIARLHVGANLAVNARPNVAEARRQFSQTARRREARPKRDRT